jgi:hypothetical protein
MAGRRSRRFLWLLFLALVAASVGFCRAARDPWPAQQGIVVPEGEVLDTARVVAETVALIDRAHVEGRPFTRSAFAKAHACVRATVDVPDLEPRLRHGLFARRGGYQAWIRFSNGDARVASDQRRDAHGLALKVMGVAGDKLLESERGADTQDFLLSDSPRFPVANVREYAELVESMARGSRFAYFLDGSLLPWRWRVRGFWLAFRARSAPPSSLLQTQYYSGTASRLGQEQFVKYGARPCEAKRSPRSDRTDDMLRLRLREELTRGDACLELTVQLQILGKNMPVENPTILWPEADSPFLPVARVTIPKQVFDTPEQDRFCEGLSFTPWHALPEHEPVGGLNRLRKAVYLELSRYRHARNAAPRGEPRGYCLDLTGATCPVATAGVAAGLAATSAAASASPGAAVSLPGSGVRAGSVRPTGSAAHPSSGAVSPSAVARPSTEAPQQPPAPEAEKPEAAMPASPWPEAAPTPTPEPGRVPTARPEPEPVPTPTPPPPGR